MSDLTNFNTRKRKSLEQPLFLTKTFAMLNECPITIACWNKEGNSFYILNQKELSENIIPKYFKHNNFSSFVRQLNFYGFYKVKTNLNYSLSKVRNRYFLHSFSHFLLTLPLT